MSETIEAEAPGDPMQWFAVVDPPVRDNIRRVELHTGEDIYLFLYRTTDRSGQCFDQWHLSEDDARAAAEAYGVDPAAWKPLGVID